MQIDHEENNCTRNFVEVRDGLTSTSSLMSRNCGTSLPAHNKTSSYRVYVKFATQGFDKAGNFTMQLVAGLHSAVLPDPTSILTIVVHLFLALAVQFYFTNIRQHDLWNVSVPAIPDNYLGPVIGRWRMDVTQYYIAVMFNSINVTSHEAGMKDGIIIQPSVNS